MELSEPFSYVIAVVDDDPVVLRSMGRLIGTFGHRVLLFDDAEMAVSAIAVALLDAVVCDLDEPGLDGVRLARRLVAVEAGIPILLITGRRERMDAADQQLFVEVLPKPPSPSALDRVLDGRVSDAAPEPDRAQLVQ